MNPVISTFFRNYGLLPDFDAFREAQSKLMLPDVHVESRDHRGWQVLDGVDAYVDSVREWSRSYDNSDDRGFEQVLDNGTDVEVKVTVRSCFASRSQAFRASPILTTTGGNTLSCAMGASPLPVSIWVSKNWRETISGCGQSRN